MASTDSTEPLIFKRKKTKPTVRTRQTSPENDTDTNASATAEDSPSTLATKLKNKVKRTKPKSRLSFGVEEEEEGNGEVFKVKKSNLSRKLALGTHPASIPPTLDQPTISRPIYDAAYLNELKASTPTTRPRLPSNSDPYDADISVDFGDISMQRPSNSDPYDADMSMDLGDLSMQGLDKEIESAAYIPSESSIKVAKEKRDRLRKNQVTGEEDFISLSVTKRADEPQGPHPESRLVREEDELGEGDDEFAEYTSAQERIALGKKSRKLEASRRRDTMKELIADAEEEDEETIEWEQEQLRRGGHKTPEPSSKVKQVYKPAPIPPLTPVPNLSSAIARLSERLTHLTTSHAKNSTALASLREERIEIDNREKEMREMVDKAEAKRAWFQSFGEWVEGVAEFLDEKYPLLESLEEEQMSLLKERSDMISNRRQEEDDDDLATFFGPLPAPLETDTDMELTDEHGRPIAKPNPADERRQRRVSRVARRQLRSSKRAKTVEVEEGYSTDSSLAPRDASAYSSALQSLASRKQDILADVNAEEFRDPRKGRWTVWREKYSDSYVGAWGGLGVVNVWEFWVRLESVGWNCIEDERNLHDFQWYNGLYEYCRPGEGTAVEDRELGPDGDLVASMVSTAVIPIICKIIEGGALDVYSQKHIVRMVDLAEEIEASLDPGNVKFQSLLKSVTLCFQAAVSETETHLAKYKTVQQSVPAFNPEAIPGRRRFLSRRVKLLRNVLRWRKYTGEPFGLGLLIGRLVEGCILGVAEGGWDVGGQEILRIVAATLPEELTPSRLKELRISR